MVRWKKRALKKAGPFCLGVVGGRKRTEAPRKWSPTQLPLPQPCPAVRAQKITTVAGIQGFKEKTQLLTNRNKA